MISCQLNENQRSGRGALNWPPSSSYQTGRLLQKQQVAAGHVTAHPRGLWDGLLGKEFSQAEGSKQDCWKVEVTKPQTVPEQHTCHSLPAHMTHPKGLWVFAVCICLLCVSYCLTLPSLVSLPSLSLFAPTPPNFQVRYHTAPLQCTY